MKKGFVLSLAAVMVVAMSGLAAADFASIMGSGTGWSTYGGFTPPSFDSNYWLVQSDNPVFDPVVTAGSLPVSVAAGQDSDMKAVYTFSSNQTFGVRVPFTALVYSPPSDNSLYHFNLDVRQASDGLGGFFVAWGSMSVQDSRRTGFAAGPDGAPAVLQDSDVRTGALGVLYDVTTKILSVGFEDNTGWHTLWTADNLVWTDNVQFSLSAGIQNGTGADALNLTFNNVEIFSSSVPLPPSILLLAPGLLGLAAVRKRYKK